MTKETNPPATAVTALVADGTPGAAESKKPWWVIVAVPVALAGSFLLRRLLQRLDPP